MGDGTQAGPRAAARRAARRLERAADARRVPLTEGRLGYAQLARRTVAQAMDDQVGAHAGNLTYHTLLAIFPFTLVVLSVLFLAGQETLLTDAVANLRSSGALSSSAADTIRRQVESLAESAPAALSFGLVASLAAALWAISGAFRAIMQATNAMYEVAEQRGTLRRFGLSVVMSVVVAVLFILALALMVGAPLIAGLFGDVGRIAWTILQWPVMIGLVLSGLALVYYFAPNVEQEFRWVTPGSLFATAAWLLFSIGFSWYVHNFGNYNRLYGTLAGVIILMLYTHYTAFIFLVGAEANQVVEHAAPHGKDRGERVATTNVNGSGGGSEPPDAG